MSVLQVIILLLSAASCCAAPMLENDRCQKPDNIKEAQLQGEWNEETYPPGKVANFACLPGYTQDGLIKMACIEGTWWQIAKGQCKGEITCNAPQVQKGSVDARKAVYRHGEEIVVKCDYGYVLQPEPNKLRKCTINGWDPAPNCVSKKCDEPDIKNGELYYNYYFPRSPRSTIDYTCNTNYLSLVRRDSWGRTECTNFGWNPEPKCLRQCSNNKTYLENAELVNLQSNYLEGEEVNFRCKSPFRTPDGKTTGIRTCLPNGEFTMAKCSITACNQPPTVQNARINGQAKNTYASGDKVTYSCNKDYSLEPSLTGEAKCENTVWINLPVCRKIGDQCGPPPTVQSGDTVDIRKNNYKTSEVVEYKCKNYYLLKGNKNVQCMNGVWGEAPVCLEPCTAKEKSMEENNIYLKWSGERKLYSAHGDTIDFSCKPGFESPPNTQMRVTCEHGKLEYPKCYKRGFCVLQQSAMIGNNIHYNVSTVLDNGQIIKFQCNEEMTPEKGLEATCSLGNIQYPKCTAAKSCKAPEIKNGFLKTPEDSYDSGQCAEFECNKDHVKNNLLSPKCENGKWTHHPVCYSPCEVSSEDLSGSNIQPVSTDIGKSYKHGEELQVSCKQGYKRPNQPSFFIECNDGKFKYSRCFSGKPCRIDQDDLDGNNLELDEVHNTDIFYEIGETIKFKCKNGFSHRDRQPTGTCAERELIYPKCIESSL
ncbi:complement factor H-related protein 4-like isoform X2 [Ranitomeya variabilis]|uniref:complement factor H-related protein 4-like isoform X2 n=1 Tax=Ranitomeya variabilis TaxID=490064 RepID=UPI004056A08B